MEGASLSGTKGTPAASVAAEEHGQERRDRDAERQERGEADGEGDALGDLDGHVGPAVVLGLSLARAERHVDVACVQNKIFRIRSTWSNLNGCGERGRSQTSQDLGTERLTRSQ